MVTEQHAVWLWEDSVGDSDKAPTDEELTTFANAVYRLASSKALEDAAAIAADGLHPEGLNAQHLVAERGVIQRHDRYDFARWLRTRAERVMRQEKQ